MNFRLWLEAKLDPAILKPVKNTFSDRAFIRRSYSLTLDKNGNVVEPDHSDFKNKEYISVEPNSRRITTYWLSPQSEKFKKIILALKPKHKDIGKWEVDVVQQAGHFTAGRDKYSRSVDYWLNRNVRFKNKVPDLYHGTSTNVWNLDIKKKGLLPRKMSGSLGSYGAQNINSISRDNLVYLSTDPDLAAREAAIQASNKHGGVPIILKIDGKQLFPEKFHPDEDSDQETASKSASKMSTVAYEGKIPPQAITPFVIGKKNEKDNRYQWRRYEDVETTELPLTKKIKEGDWFYHNDPEYFALYDAGLLDENGHIINKDSVTDEQVRKILKDAYWVSNAREIKHDLDEAYKGAIYQLESLKPEKYNQDPIIQKLLDAKIIYDEKSYYSINKWGYKYDKIIQFAKSLGKTSFSEVKKHLKSLVDDYYRSKESESE